MKDLEAEEPPGRGQYSTNGNSSSVNDEDYTFNDDQKKAALELQTLYRKLGLEDFDDGFEEGFSAYDDPQYDIVGRLREVNNQFQDDITPIESDRLRKVRFKESVVDLVVPISPIRSAYDQEFDYLEQSDDKLGLTDDYYANYYGGDDFEELDKDDWVDEAESHDRLLSDDEDNNNNNIGIDIGSQEPESLIGEELVLNNHENPSYESKKVTILVRPDSIDNEDEIIEKTIVMADSEKRKETEEQEEQEDQEEQEEVTPGDSSNSSPSSSSEEEKPDDSMSRVVSSTFIETPLNQVPIPDNGGDAQKENDNSNNNKDESVRSKTVKTKNKVPRNASPRPHSAPENNNNNNKTNNNDNMSGKCKPRPTSSAGVSNNGINVGTGVSGAGGFHDRLSSRPIKPEKLLPTYKGNSRSKYGVSEELKRELRKLKQLEAFQKKLREHELSEERKRKRDEAEAAFNAWLNQKKVNEKNKPKEMQILDVKSPNKKSSKVSLETEQAFMQWWEQKQNQIRKEKVLQKLQDDENNGNNPKTRREQSKKEYRKWLKRKTIQKRHQLALQSQLQQIPSHYTLSLHQAIQRAEMLKRTFQAYFGSSLW